MSRVKVALVLLVATTQMPTLAAAQTQRDSVVDLANLRTPVSIERQLRQALRGPKRGVERIVRNGTVQHGDFSLAQGDSLTNHLLVVRGDADIHGKLVGNLITLDGNVTVHPGGSVSGDILALNGEVQNQGGSIGGTVRAFGPPTGGGAAETSLSASTLQLTWRRLAGTASTFLMLLAFGIGLVIFARPKLEVVADTVSQSLGRSLVVGLIGQILLLPTFGILVVGLIVSVVGILLLPFVIAAYLVLVGIGVVGGCLAVAHAMGETYTRRRLAAGAIVSSNSYRYLAFGLGTLAVFWLGWALFSWVPVVGMLMWVVAFLVIWLAVTVGFGAILLSRAGMRTNFAGWEN